MHRVIRHSGTVAPVIAFSGILLAVALDPGFSWTHDALSDLGVRAGSRHVFNGALVLGGICAIAYASGLWGMAASTPQYVIAVLFALAGLHLAGVGIFVLGHPLHLPAAVGFYLLVSAVFALDGTVRWQSRSGQMTAALVLINIGIWLSWFSGIWPGDGLALPEFAAALLVPVWIWGVGPAPTMRPNERQV